MISNPTLGDANERPSSPSGRSGRNRTRRTHRRLWSTHDLARWRLLRGRIPLPDRDRRPIGTLRSMVSGVSGQPLPPAARTPPTDARWLGLRVQADNAARASTADTLLPRLVHHFATRDAGDSGVEVIDLGSGTGANQRWLAPRTAVRTRLVADRSRPGLATSPTPAAADPASDRRYRGPGISLGGTGQFSARHLLCLARRAHPGSARCHQFGSGCDTAARSLQPDGDR